MIETTVVRLGCPQARTASDLWQELRSLISAGSGADAVLVFSDAVNVSVDAERALSSTLSGQLVGSASPVPATSCPDSTVVLVPRHHCLPPPPTLLLPAVDVALFSVEAIRSIGSDRAPIGSWRDGVVALAQNLTDAGWRHVVAPGVAYAWDPACAPARKAAAWSIASAGEVAHAHVGLAAHQLWADTRLRSLRLVIDGQCVTDDIHNGTQSVVINVAKALGRRRPDASIALAVPQRFLSVAQSLLADARVDVIGRRSGLERFDVAYRPYQSIDPNDLRWFAAAATRRVVGQLDLIAYSNPSYHPSATLFHTVRNLQRHMMRTSDAVTFISPFGKELAVSECPELSPDRLHVVGCGVDVDPFHGVASSGGGVTGPFVLCLSATFHHKNRPHAIETFAAMCRKHAYPGRLVIAGPEPFYGKSDDGSVVASLEPAIADRITFVGRVDASTKWDLLRRAELVLYPSVVEGFGLVPFEAASVATPCLSYAGTALAEVLGASEVLLPTWDVNAWADRAHQLLSDASMRAGAVDAVVQASALHTWDTVAELTWDAIDAAVALPPVRTPDERPRWSRVGDDGVAANATSARHLLLRVAARGALERRRLMGSADD